MKSTVATLEDNKVKLSIEVDETEFEKEVDAAFSRIAREVRIPGFRPGKAPRKLLEARLGAGIAREEALREALPNYYGDALREHDVDAIAAPEIDVTDGQESGPVAFDAVVEVRPQVSIVGYDGIDITVPSPRVTDEDIDAQIDRLRASFGTLTDVDRPARSGDHVTVNIAGSQNGEALEGLTADGYVYEVGSGAIVPELDARLDRAKVGDILEFDAPFPDPEAGEDDLHFRVLVSKVQENVLPEADDAWAAEASEFDTLEDLRGNTRQRLELSARLGGQVALHERTAQALAELVTDELPEPLVASETQNRLTDMAMRVSSRGIDAREWLQSQDQAELLAGAREAAENAIRVDLALRAIGAAEGISVDETDIEPELQQLATQTGQDLEQIRHHYEHHIGIGPIRSEILKRKALDWVLERVTIVDADGNAVSREDLELPEAPELVNPASENPASENPEPEHIEGPD